MRRVYDNLLFEFLSHEIEHFVICDQNLLKFVGF